ncbi:MAG: DMT family transporter [Desulfobacterales bacterium]
MMQRPSAQTAASAGLKRQQLWGCLAIFGSAFFFYLATTTIRWSQAHTAIDPAFFVIVRFFLGFTVVSTSLLLHRQALWPRKFRYLLGRTIANCLAVYCFFKAVALTSVAEANILNMTYPVFIAVFTWMFLRAQRDGVTLVLVAIAMAGIWLLLKPGKIGWNPDLVWGLASGVSAAFSLTFLNLARQHDASETILLVMFGLGTVIMLGLFYDRLFVPDRTAFFFLMVSALFGVGGQYLLTFGFRYVTALEGGIISSTRILLAAFLGPYLAAENPLSAAGWIGALLIFGANVLLAVRKGRSPAGSANPIGEPVSAGKKI